MSANNEEKKEAPEQPRQVGYGNPPESSRFKKGQSGNPKGRRKGSHNVATVLAARAEPDTDYLHHRLGEADLV